MWKTKFKNRKEAKNIIKFLIVDDDHLQQEFYRQFFKSNGYRIIDCVSNGEECIEKIQELGLNTCDMPDYIIMDYRMPNKNGLETMNELLKIRPDLKIIFISADESIKELVLSSGAKAFISKPVNLNSLKDQLVTIFEETGMDQLTDKAYFTQE